MNFNQYAEIVNEAASRQQKALRDQRVAEQEEFQRLIAQKNAFISRMRQLTGLSDKLQRCRFPFPQYTDQFGYDCGNKSILKPNNLKVGLTENGSNFRVIVPSPNGDTSVDVLITETSPNTFSKEEAIALKQFVKDFPDFERAFYNWVEHLSYDLSKKVSSWLDSSLSEEFYHFAKNTPFYEIKIAPSGQKFFHPTFMFVDGSNGYDTVITYDEHEEISLPAKVTDSSFPRKCFAFADISSIGNQTLFSETDEPAGFAQEKFEEWLSCAVPLSISDITEDTPPGLYLSVSPKELEEFLTEVQSRPQTM